MTKSRTSPALLFILFLIVLFVGATLAISLVTQGEKESSGSLAGILEYHNKLGVITIDGSITSADETLKQMRKFSKKSSIKAIVLRVNSPGGTVAPAQEMYREIGRIKRKKPIVVSMETIATSAAYYISSNADRIVCSDGTITGSIGVIMMLPNIQHVIEKIGVNVAVIKAGKYKDIGSQLRPMTDEERRMLEGFAAQIHEQFISDVAAGRKGKISIDELREIADGRFFTGQKAKEMGLVDTIGNFYDAVKIAAELGLIKNEPELVYPKKKWDGYLDMFVESTVSALYKTIQKGEMLQPGPIMK